MMPIMTALEQVSVWHQARGRAFDQYVLDTMSPDDVYDVRGRGPWYHVSPHKLPPGTTVTPSGGASVYPGEGNRRDWVFVTPHKDIDSWLTELLLHEENKNPGRNLRTPYFVYQVRPHKPPVAWNADEDAAWGWATPGADVIGLVGRGRIPPPAAPGGDEFARWDKAEEANRPARGWPNLNKKRKSSRHAAKWQDAFDNAPGSHLEVTRPPEGPWYHHTPYDLPVGTTLRPHGGKSQYEPHYQEHGEQTRKNWVWLDPEGEEPAWPEDHLYEVEPAEGPYPWNGTAEEGWVVPSARVVRKVAAPRDPDVWREPMFLLDRRTDPQNPAGESWLGPEDAYDERGWERRYRSHPPDPTPTDVDWFHATWHDLPVGTVLEAKRGQAPWTDNPYHGGLDNRAHWTWVEHDVSHSDDWLRYMVRDHGEGHLYRVEPHLGPWPWNGSAKEGWVTDKAVIVEKVRDAYARGAGERAAGRRLAMPWYHASPHDLPVGTVLVPGGGESAFKDMPSAGPGEHVWLSSDPRDAQEWAETLKALTGRGHVYRVEPEDQPAVYDEDDPDQGYTSSRATIVEKL